MALTAEDRTAITDLINMHGHLVDGDEQDRMPELFIEDVTYDLTDLGRGTMTGLATLRAAALALGDANPVGHHVTNIVLRELAGGGGTADDGTGDGRTGDTATGGGRAGKVLALSKAIGVYADGTCGSVTYEDTIVRGEQGWRITYRRIRARRR